MMVVNAQEARKRHMIVDSMGILVEIAVTTANVHDTVGAKKVISRMMKWIKSNPRKLYADGGYNGKHFRKWVKSKLDASNVYH